MIKKYLRVYRVCIANSFSYEAQYRKDTIFKFFTNLLFIGMMFTIIEVIFGQTNAITGWSKAEIYLMTSFWILADEIYACLFSANLPFIPDAIVNGDLDLLIVKPISPLFLASMMRLLVRGFFRFLTQLIILIVILWKFHLTFSLSRSLLATALMLVAVWIDYSRVLIANTFSFWFLKIDNINEAIGYINALGKYPLNIWPKAVKILFLTALPVVFTGFIPTATLTGRWPWYGVAYAFWFAAFLFLVAVRFWNFALRRYSSASS